MSSTRHQRYQEAKEAMADQWDRPTTGDGSVVEDSRDYYSPFAAYKDGVGRPIGTGYAVPGIVKRLIDDAGSYDPNRQPQAQDPSSVAGFVVSNMIGAGLPVPGKAVPKGALGANAFRTADEVEAPFIAAAKPERRMPETLEEYVDMLKKRQVEDYGPGKQIIDYDRYLEAPGDVVVPEAVRTGPVYGARAPVRDLTPEAKRLTNQHVMRNYENLATQGMMRDPGGAPVNPWYWPTARLNLIRRIFGDEQAEAILSQIHGNMAVTSPGTNVIRNAQEGFHTWSQANSGDPMKLLTPNDLLGKAYNWKRDAAAHVNETGAIPGEGAFKVGNYKLALDGGGTGGAGWQLQNERNLTPGITVLDRVMAREGGLINARTGEAKERFGTPAQYWQGATAVNRTGQRMANRFEAPGAPSDTQAGIWQAAQLLKHGHPDYAMPFDYFFEKVLRGNASHYGISPERFLEDMAAGKRKPANIYGNVGPAAPFMGTDDGEMPQ